VLIAAGGFVFVLVATGAVTLRRRRAAPSQTSWDTLDDGQIVWLRFEVDGVRHLTPLGIRRTVSTLAPS
jgi:hypothetical protein